MAGSMLRFLHAAVVVQLGVVVVTSSLSSSAWPYRYSATTPRRVTAVCT